jgi:hypothetical protein
MAVWLCAPGTLKLKFSGVIGSIPNTGLPNEVQDLELHSYFMGSSQNE